MFLERLKLLSKVYQLYNIFILFDQTYDITPILKSIIDNEIKNINDGQIINHTNEIKLVKVIIKQIKPDLIKNTLNYIFLMSKSKPSSNTENTGNLLENELIYEVLLFTQELFPNEFNKSLLDFNNNTNTSDEIKKIIANKILNVGGNNYLFSGEKGLIDVYLGLNNQDYKVFMSSVDQIDNIIESKKVDGKLPNIIRSEIERFIPSLTFRFLNSEQEYILTKVLTMKNLHMLIEMNSQFKLDIKQFYVQLITSSLKYSK